MDRLAPSIRPPGRNAGTQRWRDLLFLHWEVDPSVLRPLVPTALELDLFEGRAFVGVVPFLMRGIRPSWWPGPAFDFYETNLRTYVQRAGDDPGVYFFSLEASSWLAVQAARKGWGLPYHHARMTGADNEGRVVPGAELTYESTRHAGAVTFQARCRVGQPLSAPALGTLEHFLLERYYLYNVRGGRLHRGQVHHVPYPAHSAEALSVRDELIGAAGLPPVGTRPPDHVHYSPGVDVEVFAVRPV
ncbi:MAG: DUF2071 domain-containing protein [Sandaracinaceae bacterium]|nr:DUF2071 domain-containing protein [Myxococcales bacterium]MCB9656977.1 DUF2071 domain-containing protein [Sandaracinaceae bacterium]